MSEGHDNQRGLCPVCGSPLAEGAQFCGACGSHVPTPLNPYDAPTTPDGVPFESASVAPTVPGISGLAVETGVRCMTCGATNIVGAEVCAACGASLLDEVTRPPSHSQPGRNGNQP